MVTDREKFMGIDLHTNRFNYHMIDDNGETKSRGFEINEGSLRQFYQHIDKNTHLMLEASANSFKFYDLVKDRVKDVIVANPRQLRLISFVNKKTDKIDAEKLARYLKMQLKGGEKLTEPVYVPEQRIRDLRSFLSTYQLLNRQITQSKNRIHSLLKQNLVLTKRDTLFTRSSRERVKQMHLDPAVRIQIDMLFDHVDILEKTKHKIEGEMKIAASHYYKEIDILTSMTGISILTAIVLIADIAYIKRFSNAKKLASYLRSSPKIDSSNETVKIRGTNKCGRKHSLSMLAQSCNHFINTNKRLNRWYLKKQGTKKASSLRMAILRNVIVEIYHMLSKQEYHWYRNEPYHSRKMREYNNFLKKHGITIN
jgi:transposase